MKTYLGDAGTQAAFSYGELSPDYAQAIETTAPGITQQADAMRLPWESALDSITRAISTLAMADAQRKLLQVQIQRASQGLPPLNSAQYGIGASVNVGLSPDVQRMLWIGGAGLLAVLVLPKLIR